MPLMVAVFPLLALRRGRNPFSLLGRCLLLSDIDYYSLYNEKNSIIENYGGVLTSPFEFYRYLFPVGSFERKGCYEDNRPNGVFLTLDGEKAFKHILTDELSELSSALGDTFSIMSPVSYYGRNRNGRNASELYAFTVDLDGVGIRELKNLLHQFSHKVLLTPTFLVNSGHGFHLYYVLDEPVPLYPFMQRKLKDVKYALIRNCWTGYTSTIEEPQIQGILQGFRMVGSSSKLGSDYPVIAYKLGERVSLEQIMMGLPEDVYISEREYMSELPLKKAAELYPEWYNRRIVKGEPKGRWHIKRDLYDWWKRQIVKARYGHRYFCIMCLAIYAMKCDIPEDELRADAFSFIPILNFDDDHPFTEDDVIKALEVYNENYCTFPRYDIEKISGLPIPKNKRNGRKQSLHLKLARSNRDILCEERGKSDWREGNGRPTGSGTAANKVYEWRQQHPDGRKADCHRDTGLDPKTIRKWWDYVPPKKVNVLEAPFSDVQHISMDIVSECQRIAAEQNISEEEAYELYKQDNRNVQLVKPMSKREQLQEELDNLIFSESEYGALPDEFKSKVFAMGLKPRIVPDDEYEVAMAEEFFRGLKK